MYVFTYLCVCMQIGSSNFNFYCISMPFLCARAHSYKHTFIHTYIHTHTLKRIGHIALIGTLSFACSRCSSRLLVSPGSPCCFNVLLYAALTSSFGHATPHRDTCRTAHTLLIELSASACGCHNSDSAVACRRLK